MKGVWAGVWGGKAKIGVKGTRRGRKRGRKRGVHKRGEGTDEDEYDGIAELEGGKR